MAFVSSHYYFSTPHSYLDRYPGLVCYHPPQSAQLIRLRSGDLQPGGLEHQPGSSFASSLEVSSFLGDHVAPVLLLVAPLYWLWSDARMLLIVQAIALCLGAIPVYWIAQRTLTTAYRQPPAANGQQPIAPFLPLIFGLAYLLYPAIGFMNRFDFHTIVLATPILLFAWDAMDRGRDRLATVLILLALACNEEIGLSVFALGLYVALVRRQRG
ncbi:MAG: DUF2079 domain-containing protein [Chloroflexi bacterium]|nr:DUF2079 domain-containing protein [Chloroflexota bacterium]